MKNSTTKTIRSWGKSTHTTGKAPAIAKYTGTTTTEWGTPPSKKTAKPVKPAKKAKKVEKVKEPEYTAKQEKALDKLCNMTGSYPSVFLEVLRDKKIDDVITLLEALKGPDAITQPKSKTGKSPAKETKKAKKAKSTTKKVSYKMNALGQINAKKKEELSKVVFKFAKKQADKFQCRLSEIADSWCDNRRGILEDFFADNKLKVAPSMCNTMYNILRQTHGSKAQEFDES